MKAESDDIMLDVNLKSYMHQKRIFKCSPDVSQLLPLKLGRTGKMVVIISNINIKLKLKTKQLYTFMMMSSLCHESSKQTELYFPSLSMSILVFGAPFVFDLPDD